MLSDPIWNNVFDVTGRSEDALATPNVACSSRRSVRMPSAAPGIPDPRIASTSASATARNSGEALRATKAGSGSSGAGGPDFTVAAPPPSGARWAHPAIAAARTSIIPRREIPPLLGMPVR